MIAGFIARGTVNRGGYQSEGSHDQRYGFGRWQPRRGYGPYGRGRGAYAASGAPETSDACYAEDQYDDSSEGIQSLQEQIAKLRVQNECYQQREVAGNSAEVGVISFKSQQDQGRKPVKDLAMDGGVESNTGPKKKSHGQSAGIMDASHDWKLHDQLYAGITSKGRKPYGQARTGNDDASGKWKLRGQHAGKMKTSKGRKSYGHEGRKCYVRRTEVH